ncbi:MAG TPA: hypothetical protein VL857_08430, partial [Candidatus Eisenbacteria bacterium]|nr:hypothetical protein [Candidatus Eisenbacteria bacterium]
MLTALAGLYVALVWMATNAASPRNWGIHSAGFLAPPVQHAILALMALAVAALALDAGGWLRPRRPKAARSRSSPRTSTRQAPKRKASHAPPLWLIALPLYGILLYALRTRTHFLGDGGVWLNMLLGGTIDPF